LTSVGADGVPCSRIYFPCSAFTNSLFGLLRQLAEVTEVRAHAHEMTAARGPISRISLYFSLLAGNSSGDWFAPDCVAHHLTFAQISRPLTSAAQLADLLTKNSVSAGVSVKASIGPDGALINLMRGVLRRTSGAHHMM
jgi:hypothetical protein